MVKNFLLLDTGFAVTGLPHSAYRLMFGCLGFCFWITWVISTLHTACCVHASFSKNCLSKTGYTVSWKTTCVASCVKLWVQSPAPNKSSFESTRGSFSYNKLHEPLRPTWYFPSTCWECSVVVGNWYRSRVWCLSTVVLEKEWKWAKVQKDL